MKGPGRNAPCPCGSGRKYKHCCIRGEGPEPDVATDPMAWRRWRGTRAMRELRRLVDKEQWAEAEAVCERIRTDFPGEPVFELALATVRVAQGRYAEVAEL
ncbi:MAG: SEC-C domain-containing protein, partial [Planctomycetes bacterium]|nr:SEC-C domain-containing protein [Planctomycetota bacterium]